ncbi:MAG: serpin family protein, partial [Candidatus Korarchaeum sp.]|nr:serpin family protein [Candidatus Korarchaeum sp.]MDW8035320.1 serpin family protein [Candidatus Korarchaeum sp.]
MGGVRIRYWHLFLVLLVILSLVWTIGTISRGEQKPLQRMMSEDDVKNSLNAFAFDLFLKLELERENNIVSPLSVYSALVIVYEGAEGETADEMASTLHLLGENPAQGYRSLLESLSGIEALKVANALWVQRDFPIRRDYLKRVSDYYSGVVENLDFAKDPEGSRRRINEFVREKTAGKIDELLPRGSLDGMTRLVVTNAAHFKGNWKYRF